LPEDTIAVRDGRPFHVDCRKPRTLTAEERALILLYCRTHALAQCLACLHNAHLGELTSDPLGAGPYLCPECFRDLTELVRAHLYDCALLPAEVRRRAEAFREASVNLVKQNHQLRDKADVLLRAAEVALEESRGALRRSLKDRRAD